MHRWPVPDIVVFAISYAVALLVVFLINRRDFRRSPEKGERYRALPLGYKLLCWCVVVPLFAGTIVMGPLFVPAIVAHFFVEAACIRWYQKAGLLPR